MNKIFISISILAVSLTSAQRNNESLEREFEKQRIENNKKFDAYVVKRYGTSRDPKILKEIEEQRATLAGFNFGVPYFLQEQDTKQVINSNADLLNTSGNIAGLDGAFNGEGIKYTIFDGGRIFQDHSAFDNIANRITNKEDLSLSYSAHATGVGSFVGGKAYYSMEELPLMSL